MVRRLIGVSALCVIGASAHAEAVALVEEIGEPRPGVQFMDYLNPGQMIPLHAGERFVIDYIKSCLRETIVGGVVSIGTDKSTVVGGKVSSETVECDGGKGMLTTAQASTATATLYGTSPLFELTSAGKLVIERIDQPGERHVADIAAGTKRVFYDCAKEGFALAPGGLYKASSGGHELTFRIAESAKPGALPPVSRLLHL
jgi:hypothetical protein